MTKQRETLHQVLVDYFSLDELKTLCFYLDINYETFEGNGIIGKSRDLITYTERRGHYEDLIAEVKKQRPNVAESLEIEKIQNTGSKQNSPKLPPEQQGNRITHLQKFGLSASDLKKNLAQLGYYQGNLDESYTQELVDAIVEFQKRNNVGFADGILGNQTYRIMVEKLKEDE